MPSFTERVANLESVGPVVEVILTVPAALAAILHSLEEPLPAPVQVLAMVDTGASGTVVREDVVQLLGLDPTGSVLISTPSSSQVPCLLYHLRLQFSNHVAGEVTAIAAPLPGQHIQCLIGRDVLAHAVFVYNGPDDTFTLAL